MLIYMAGCPGGVQRMPHKFFYRHVLFSKFVMLKKDFAWLRKRKEKEIKKRDSMAKD